MKSIDRKNWLVSNTEFKVRALSVYLSRRSVSKREESENFIQKNPAEPIERISCKLSEAFVDTKKAK